jgi:hypothetical protein
MVQTRKDLEVSFQRWVNRYRKAQKIKENYKVATSFYRKHPEEDCKQAIESLDSAGCSNGAAPPQSQPGTKPIGLAGDFTSALSLLKILTQRKTLEKEPRRNANKSIGLLSKL